jgi:hypothetical protein
MRMLCFYPGKGNGKVLYLYLSPSRIAKEVTQVVTHHKSLPVSTYSQQKGIHNAHRKHLVMDRI